MRIALVLYGEILSPVVQSQTFLLARALRERGHGVHLFALTSPRRLLSPRLWRSALESARRAVDGEMTVLTHSPGHRRYGPLSRRLARALRRFDPDVVHARQSRGGVVAGRAGIAPVLLDSRGVRPEEYLLSVGKEEADLGRREAKVLRRMRREDEEARSAAAAIVCVSEPFREHLGGGDNVFVIPNAAPRVEAAPRKEIRQHLGIGEDEIAYVYAGSFAEWQCAEETVRLFCELRRRNAAARLALLTPWTSRARRLVEEAGIDDAIVMSLSADSVRRTLHGFDGAFLLRRSSIVNRVAAPVKFAEYLHAGLPVILTEGIGDASRTVRDERLGVVLPSPDDPGNVDLVLDRLEPEAGIRGRAYARKHLTFSVTVPLYEEAYRAARGGGV